VVEGEKARKKKQPKKTRAGRGKACKWSRVFKLSAKKLGWRKVKDHLRLGKVNRVRKEGALKKKNRLRQV